VLEFRIFRGRASAIIMPPDMPNDLRDSGMIRACVVAAFDRLLLVFFVACDLSLVFARSCDLGFLSACSGISPRLAADEVFCLRGCLSRAVL